jgi:hypothetical protein
MIHTIPFTATTGISGFRVVGFCELTTFRFDGEAIAPRSGKVVLRALKSKPGPASVFDFSNVITEPR